MIKISNRLKAVASLISEGNVLADVGTDHGYVPIYLMQQGKIPRAIAMDINKGPLERAREHIMLFGMGDYIETRLSDGLAALKEGEAESVLIAGMGGGLVIHILEAGSGIAKKAKELVLQPQSELERVRRFLEENGYVTEAEDMVFEDGKYYPMMRVCYAPEKLSQERGEKLQSDYIYGAGLLAQRHPVLLEYLKKEKTTYHGIYENLKKQPPSEHIRMRRKEIEAAISQNEKALSYYDKKDEVR